MTGAAGLEGLGDGRHRIRYTKLEQIGIGEGMNSTVYRATDPHLNGEIVVKEIPKVIFGNDSAAYVEEAQRMFASEHDNVVKIRCACETADLIGLLMPYYVRGSLAKRIKDHPLGLGELLRVADGEAHAPMCHDQLAAECVRGPVARR